MTMLPNLYPGISRPLEGAQLRVMSWGAGVQSTTMMVLAAEGLIGPMPDLAIFADPVDEPRDVYEHIRFMRSPNRAPPFPIEEVTAGSIRDEMLAWSRGEINNSHGRPPMFVMGKDAQGRPKVGMTNRQCTQDWKIRPIERRVAELVGIKPRSPGPRMPIVEQWIGISTDEIGRLKPARKRWIHNRHPLIEIGWDRRQCERFLEDRGIFAPKSACRICPFHSDAEWLRLFTKSPIDFEAACEVDDALRSGRTLTKGQPYLHRSCKPLREIDFTVAMPDPIGWLGECEGMCGV